MTRERVVEELGIAAELGAQFDVASAMMVVDTYVRTVLAAAEERAEKAERERDEATALLLDVAEACRGHQPPSDAALSVLGNALRERDDARAALAAAEARAEAAEREHDR